jgi:SAM-dependent methyltransferase
MGTAPYHPNRFAGGNMIDAMALIAKSAWSAVGGYAEMRSGWEDYDFWCALAEIGLHGYAMGGLPLADYRVHGASMLAQVTDKPEIKHSVIAAIEQRHPWIEIARPLEPNAPKPAPVTAGSRLERLVPILRCPLTHQALTLDGAMLRTADGSRCWPVKAGRPVLFPDMDPESVAMFSHFSNEVPASALRLIEAAKGLVLNLSAGGTHQRFDHVIEAEAAIFGHTDLVADSHALPFADGSFEVVIAMNAFEHYRDPVRAAAEIHRVLQPGGKVLIRTAFLQPQHEAPYHFYNATRFGVEEWFAAFETEQLHVSENFNPSYALAWMAHECQAALRKDAGAAAAERFAAAPIGQFARFWTDPASRHDEAWTMFGQLSQPAQQALAAGFEYLGRRPL